MKLIDIALYSRFLCLNSLPQSQILKTQYKKQFENNVGQGENAGYQHLVLYKLKALQTTI